MVDSMRRNALDPKNDIGGTDPSDQFSDLDLSDELIGFGPVIVGQTGNAASMVAFNSSTNLLTITGLTNMSSSKGESLLVISGADHVGNNGIFTIINYNSATSVDVLNSNGAAPDANNGAITWQQREPYTLATDLNFQRTDRSLIKGVAYSSSVPSYQRADTTNINVPANLSNIAGKTLDAKAQIINKRISDIPVSAGSTYVTITSTGNLPHSSSVDFTGVPLFDNYLYQNNYTACYVEIVNKIGGGSLESLIDPTKRIFGLTRKGSSASPDSMEIEFRAVTKGEDLSTSTIYTWEVEQATVVHMYYGFGVRADLLDPSYNRVILSNGVSSNTNTNSSSDSILDRLILETNGALVYIGDGDILLKS